MKLSVLVLILGASSTAAYFSGRIYIMMAEQHAQAVALEQRQKDFFTNNGQPMPWPKFENRGLR